MADERCALSAAAGRVCVCVSWHRITHISQISLPVSLIRIRIVDTSD